MKALKFTLVATLFIACLSSCTKQDLNEDNVLVDNTQSISNTKGNLPD